MQGERGSEVSELLATKSLSEKKRKLKNSKKRNGYSPKRIREGKILSDSKVKRYGKKILKKNLQKQYQG